MKTILKQNIFLLIAFFDKNIQTSSGSVLNKDEIKSTGKSNSLLKRAQIPETSGNETIGLCLLKSIFLQKMCN